MIGNLNPTEIDKVLQQNLIGRIGCALDGRAYIVPITYAYDGESIFAHTTEGLKIEMMRKNPKVCFEVDNTEDLSNWKSVIAWGEFEELKEGAARKNGLDQLINREYPLNTSVTMRLGSHWPFMGEDGITNEEISGIVFRIRLTEKTGKFESNRQSPNMVG